MALRLICDEIWWIDCGKREMWWKTLNYPASGILIRNVLPLPGELWLDAPFVASTMVLT